MSLRTRIIIIIGVVVLILAMLIFVIVQSVKKRQASENVTPAPTSTASGVTVIDSSNFSNSQFNTPTSPTVNTTTQITVDPGEATKASVRQFARVFIERVGTYSSDNSLQNIRDVETMVTPNLYTYLSRSTTSSSLKNQPFIGVTTKVVTADITSWSDAAATIQFQAIKTETHNNATSSTQPGGSVKLVKQGAKWLVDGIYWNK